MKMLRSYIYGPLLFFWFSATQAQPANMRYTVSMEDAPKQYYHVVLNCTPATATTDFNMCAWTPGYYQIMDYAKAVENFTVADAAGNSIKWEKLSKNGWRVFNSPSTALTITYDVKATSSFVANAYLDTNRAYITPGALFLYTDRALQQPVTIQMKPYHK